MKIASAIVLARIKGVGTINPHATDYKLIASWTQAHFPSWHGIAQSGAQWVYLIHFCYLPLLETND